ncbi:MAG: complex I NDUFA9 subunit family protein, partial [Geminicoccaceae bacterium]
MRVLLTGASGFIGRHLCAGLLAAGHEVIGAVRDPAALRRRFPEISTVRADLNRDLRPEIWHPRLAGVHAVINCAGILQGGRGQSIEAIHHQSPLALFEACALSGVRRVVQVSAISADAAAGTAYASSKQRADDALRALDLDWVVLRPSLVYARGAYGGTSLLRGLAALPFVLPVPGSGAQPFQPIHAGDLVRTVLRLLEAPGIRRVTLEPVGPEEVSLRELLVRLRAWLGLPKARLVFLPLPLIRLATRVGDRLGSAPVNTTALAQLEHGNAAPCEPFVKAIGFMPRALAEALSAEPAEAQDLWHARLYFLGPLLRAALALLWLGSGALGLLHGG